ncbi:hypothetical protein ACWQV9_09690 [Brevundimonas diminuta]
MVVVSSAGRGLGAALAISLAEAGSRPILCGRNREAFEGVASTILERTACRRGSLNWISTTPPAWCGPWRN